MTATHDWIPQYHEKNSVLSHLENTFKHKRGRKEDSKCGNVIEETLNEELTNLTHWCQANKLSID